jgi:curved DNA-binding protein CbpA
VENRFIDYYQILGLEWGASEAEIKAAFKQKAREYHPDKNPEDTETYTALFQQVVAAYEMLSDSTKKADYDYDYRVHILGETPYYEYVYVYDTTPPDTREYKHVFTKNRVQSNPWMRIVFGIIILLALLAPQLKKAVDGYAVNKTSEPIQSPLHYYNNDTYDKGLPTFMHPNEKR